MGWPSHEAPELGPSAHAGLALDEMNVLLGPRTQGAACEKAEAVYPSPATHAFLTDLKAGESVFQTLLVVFYPQKQWFMHMEEHSHCFMHCFGAKTLSECRLFPRL